MLKRISILSASILTFLCVANFAQSAVAQEVTLTQDDITTYDGLPWGANNWPYKTKINIVKYKGDTEAIGWAVLDRHGIDEPVEPIDALLSFLAYPFTNPNPVRAVFVSTWVARQDGCFMELLVQVAPPKDISDTNLSKYLIPAKVQLKLGDDIVTLAPKDVEDFRYSRIPIPYTFYSATLKKYLSSTWYMARNRFYVTREQKTKFITDAPTTKTNLLITFLTGKRYVFPIGESTTKLWPEVYAFNTPCAPNQPTKPITVSQQVFRPRDGNELPSPPEFQSAEILTARYTKEHSNAKPQLTAAERQQRSNFQKSWATRNEKVTKFLGAWKRDEEAVYVYPSYRKGYACVVAERKPGEMKFNIGYTYSGGELIYSYKSKRTDSLYWRNTPSYLLVRDFGPNLLRPVFASNQQPPALSDAMKKQFEESKCLTAFEPPTSNQTSWNSISVIGQMLAWLRLPKLSSML